MKDFSKATSRPWIMCLPEYGGPHHIASFIDGNKATLADVDFSHLRTALNLMKAKGEVADFIDVSYEAQEANANLIVTAVNNFDKMKEALEYLISVTKDYKNYNPRKEESAKQLLESLK